MVAIDQAFIAYMRIGATLETKVDHLFQYKQMQRKVVLIPLAIWRRALLRLPYNISVCQLFSRLALRTGISWSSPGRVCGMAHI